jgi:hypothetical protein
MDQGLLEVEPPVPSTDLRERKPMRSLARARFSRAMAWA